MRQTMMNPRDTQHRDYEAAARKIWGHDNDPLNARDTAAVPAIVPAVTIIADAANAPAQNSDAHGSAGEVDNSIPTTSTAPPVKDGKVAQSIPPSKAGNAASPIAAVVAGKAPAAAAHGDDDAEDTPAEAYRKAWGA